MQQPKVSIVIPVYNASRFIERCVESLFAQSYKNLEIFLVNDGSTDKSGELIDVIASSQPNVMTVHQENRGPAVARRSGALMATGDYVMFLDSDDTLEPNAIEFLVRKAAEVKLDAIYCGSSRIINKTVIPSPPSKKEGVMTGTEMLQQLLDPEFYYIACMCFSKRKFWDANMFVENRNMPSEDILTNIKLVKKCERVGLYNERLYNYHFVETSLTSTRRYFKQSLWKQYFEELYKLLDGNEWTQAIRKNEIYTFGFYIDKIDVSDEWYKKMLKYNVSDYSRKIKVLHALLHWPWLLRLCVNGNRWRKRMLKK